MTDPATLAAIVTVFGPALIKVLEKLADKVIIDPTLGPFSEQVKAWATGKYNQKKAEADLLKVMQASLPPESHNFKLFLAFSDLKSQPDLAVKVAAATVKMTSEAESNIQPNLLSDLKLDDSHRRALAAVLFSLRRNLAESETYRAGIAYADALDRLGLLRELLRKSQREIEIEESFLADRRLTTDDAQALRDYLAVAREQSRVMPLPIVQRTADARTDADLTKVFVPLTLRDPQHESKDLRGRTNREDPEGLKPLSFGDVFRRYPRFLLRGDPGSGKTTLLRRAALSFVEGTSDADLGWKGKPLLPVFVRLRNFGIFLNENRAKFSGAAYGALTAFIENYFREEHRLPLSAGFFDRRLEEGGCLILLDGLDEVTQNRAAVAQCVGNFIRHFEPKGNRFGISSRPKGYESVELYLRPAAPTVADVNPLDAQGITQLVINLLRLLRSDPVVRAKDEEELPRQILGTPAVAQIAGTPLFCTALVMVYNYHGAHLPQRRVDVYHEIVNLLLGFWKPQERDLSGGRELEFEDGTGVAYADESSAVGKKKSRLAHLALWMQENRLTDAPTDQARESLAAFIQEKDRKDKDAAAGWAENFLLNAHERSGIFVEIEPGKYAFTHQGFREYLVATAVKDMRDDQFIRVILDHLADDWWEQVVLLAGAYPGLPPYRRTDLIEKILESANDESADLKTRHARLIMGGRCAVDMAGDLPESHREMIQRALFHLMRDTDAADNPRLTSPAILSPKTRLEAGLLLDSLDWTPPDLYDFVPVFGTTDRENDSDRNPPNSPNPLFLLARYPVTNFQYARFRAAEDYDDEKIWQAVIGFDEKGDPLKNAGIEAWDWFQRAGKRERKPTQWDDPRFGASRRLLPVVGVTWYEAAAYCVWLERHLAEWGEGGALTSNFTRSVQTSNFKLRLPTEGEWVAAAGGEGAGKDKVRYAWQEHDAGTAPSNDEILMRANTDLSQLGGTSPVCMYPAGKRPGGAFDMSGNVWEWQANLYKKGESWLGLRGGSWFYRHDYARVSARSYSHLDDDWYYDGGRLAALPSG